MNQVLKIIISVLHWKICFNDEIYTVDYKITTFFKLIDFYTVDFSTFKGSKQLNRIGGGAIPFHRF